MNLKNKLTKQRSKKAGSPGLDNKRLDPAEVRQEEKQLTSRGGFVGKKWSPQAPHKKSR
jgi:hypothetical protein